MPRRGARPGEACAALAAWGAAVLVSGLFFWMLGDILSHGIGGVSWTFLIAPPKNAGRAGGIGPILVSTGLILAVCLAAAVPIGLGAAVLLSEFTTDRTRFGRLVRWSLDALAGVPSILFGLFGNAFFCNALGLRFSILSGGLTLACMVLPILIRSVEAGLRAVPLQDRLAAAAVGLTRTAALRHLFLPAAAPGLLAGLLLGIGRAVSETAALIFTSGYVGRMPDSLLDSGRALSVHIFDLSMNIPGGDRNAYASALVLMVLILLINIGATRFMTRWQKRRIVTA